jgi:hypothetical protein
MRNVAPETIVAEALEAIAADLRQTLADLLRPPALAEAETRVIEAREARATFWDAYRSIVAERLKTPARSEKDDQRVFAAKAAVDKAEAEVVRAQRALAKHREAYGRKIALAIERHRAAAAAAVTGATDILAVAAAAAAREFVTLPDVVEFSPAMQGMIEAAGRSRMAQQNRADRQFSRSAAAMAARAAPPQPAAGPIRWTGKLSEMSEVVDGPVLISPRANTTTQRIPAAAMGSFPRERRGGLGLAAAATNFIRRKPPDLK